MGNLIFSTPPFEKHSWSHSIQYFIAFFFLLCRNFSAISSLSHVSAAQPSCMHPAALPSPVHSTSTMAHRGSAYNFPLWHINLNKFASQRSVKTNGPQPTELTQSLCLKQSVKTSVSTNNLFIRRLKIESATFLLVFQWRKYQDQYKYQSNTKKVLIHRKRKTYSGGEYEETSTEN